MVVGWEPGSNRTVRFEQVNPTRNSASCKVEFGDGRAIPETAPSLSTSFVCDHSVRKRAGNKSAAAQVERLLYLSGVDVQKYNAVGDVVGYEQAFAGRSGNITRPAGYGSAVPVVSFAHTKRNLLPCRQALRRNLDEALRRYLAKLANLYNRDAVARALWLGSRRIK